MGRLPFFKKLKWTPLDDHASPGTTGAFYKTYKNFAFFWILKAGHVITSDQGPMARCPEVPLKLSEMALTIRHVT